MVEAASILAAIALIGVILLNVAYRIYRFRLTSVQRRCEDAERRDDPHSWWP